MARRARGAAARGGRGAFSSVGGADGVPAEDEAKGEAKDEAKDGAVEAEEEGEEKEEGKDGEGAAAVGGPLQLHGLHLLCARWDREGRCLARCRPKELSSALPPLRCTPSTMAAGAGAGGDALEQKAAPPAAEEPPKEADKIGGHKISRLESKNLEVHRAAPAAAGTYACPLYRTESRGRSSAPDALVAVVDLPFRRQDGELFFVKRSVSLIAKAPEFL